MILTDRLENGMRVIAEPMQGVRSAAIGVWIAMIIDWVCRSICFVGRFVRGKWKLQKI